ncbi:MAG: DNA repair protein RecN [Flavobacteriales bacterium]|nr:DNA repair protein RecN [Flavobacteriales bacterium]
MLRHLTISNYALIDKIEVDLHDGFTAITGETGSGKSILMDALELALGERADSKIFRDNTSRCVVEATFNLEGFKLNSFFASNDLDFDEQTVLRREISPGGKSRAFINDNLVQLNTLRELGKQLIDIHSQHENALITERTFQFGCVDAFAKNEKIRQQYSEIFTQHKKAQAELDALIAQESKLRQDLDYFRFQFEELEKAKLDTLYLDELQAELVTLTHAETIRSTLDSVIGLLDGNEQAVLANLSTAKNLLSKVSVFNSTLAELHQRTENSWIEMRDMLSETERVADEVVFDQQRIDQVNEHLSLFQHLLKKHALQTASELIALRNDLQKKINTAEYFEEIITGVRKKNDSLKSELSVLALEVSASRIKAIPELEKAVFKSFIGLSLENAELKATLTKSENFHALGNDEISILFRANKGSSLQPIKEVASGGEMSRVMLALKSSISKYRKLPTIILDEIDQGVSGEVAKNVGHIMHQMSQYMQVLAITHLPQIAGQAGHHLKVYKTTGKNSTTTHLEVLEGENRVNELAEMLGGKSLSDAARESARELMR